MLKSKHFYEKFVEMKDKQSPTYNAFYASKLLDYVEEGLLFQNIVKI